MAQPLQVLTVSFLRLVSRALIVLMAVLGLSLSFAWAWDRSDRPAVEAR